MSASATRVRPERIGELQLLACSFFYGSGFLLQRSAQTQTPIGPISFSAARNIVSACFMLAMRRTLISATADSPDDAGTDLTSPSLWIYGTIGGVCNTCASILQQFALVTVSAGKVAFITSLYMVIVPFAECNANTRTYVAAFVAAVGVYLLSGCEEDAVCFGGALGNGELAVISSLVFWVISIMTSDRAASDSRVNPINLTVLDFGISAVLCLIVSLVAEPGSFSPPFTSLRAAGWRIVGVGVFEAVGFTLSLLGQRHVAVSRASLLLSLEGAVGAMFGYVFLNENLTYVEAIGAALMLSSTTITSLEGDGSKVGAQVTVHAADGDSNSIELEELGSTGPEAVDRLGGNDDLQSLPGGEMTPVPVQSSDRAGSQGRPISAYYRIR